MSTDGSDEQPLTRAQLRALRAAEEDAAAAPRPLSEDPSPAPRSLSEERSAETKGPDAPRSLSEERSPETKGPRAPRSLSEERSPETKGPETSGSLSEDPSAAPRSLSEERSPETKGPDAPEPEASEARQAPEPVEDPDPDAWTPSTGPTPTPPRERTPRPATGPATRRFRLGLLATVGVLALVVVSLGVVSLVQGPRLSGVEVNEAQAIDTSGSRVILTANQSLAAIDPEQITVEPAVPFTIDAAGRNVGIRFTIPLDDSTKYTVRVAGVTSSGGGPSADLTTTFTTPASSIFLLQRSAEDDDKIFATDLTGESGVPVFAHPRISDFRATPELLVVAVEEDEGSRLIVMRRDGSGQRDLELPGDGYISSVQVSDRGGLVGYSYSDRELTDTAGRASVLVTQPLNGDAEPRIVQVGDEDTSVADWQFVPDSSSLLFIDFNGSLSVEDPAGDAGVQPMGLAASILGINRGTYTAVVQRPDASFVELDLTTGEEQALPSTEPDYGPATTIVPIPDGTLRHVVQRDDAGMPTGQAVIRVDDEGVATPIAEVSGTDAILQTCASPSGQYAAVVVAPDLPTNDYDDLLLPLPTTLHTQLIDLTDGSVLVTLQGFDVSWCRLAPRP